MDCLTIFQRYDSQNARHVIPLARDFAPEAYTTVRLSFASKWGGDDVNAPVRIDIRALSQHLLLKVTCRLHSVYPNIGVSSYGQQVGVIASSLSMPSVLFVATVLLFRFTAKKHWPQKVTPARNRLRSRQADHRRVDRRFPVCVQLPASLASNCRLMTRPFVGSLRAGSPYRSHNSLSGTASIRLSASGRQSRPA